MRQLPEIDPLTVQSHPSLVASLPDDRYPNRRWYFLVIGEYMIMASTYYKASKNRWLHYQIEFPKQGLLWYLDTIHNKFFKTEAEGGLPKGTFHDRATIEGERLALQRAFNADGQGGGGYSFVTVDRRDKVGSVKEYTFTDALLFEHGLMNLLDNVADKIRAGQL